LIVQDRKICGLLGQEKIINRNDVGNWFASGEVYRKTVKKVAFRTDFNSSFTLLKSKDLDFDLLYLSQYIEEENRILSKILNKKINTKAQLGLEYVKDLKTSFSKNNWKTTWGKKAAAAFIDTITQLEAVKF